MQETSSQELRSSGGAQPAVQDSRKEDVNEPTTPQAGGNEGKVLDLRSKLQATQVCMSATPMDLDRFSYLVLPCNRRNLARDCLDHMKSRSKSELARSIYLLTRFVPCRRSCNSNKIWYSSSDRDLQHLAVMRIPARKSRNTT